MLTHVKPHGALNNMACEDAALAATVARAVKAFDATLILLAPALSQLQRAGEAAGLAVGIEVFADRAYTDEGNLVPRSKPGAVLHAAEDCVAHVLRFVEAGGIVCASGKILKTLSTASAFMVTGRRPWLPRRRSVMRWAWPALPLSRCHKRLRADSSTERPFLRQQA